ncbi:MAG: HutD family protein [Lysobacterales bacterium]
MLVIRYQELRPSPWKNGLGLTWEIARDPPGDSSAPFRWRLSRARITATSPFSAFPGVRRVLALAAGGALELRIDREPPRMLERPGDWIAFAGDAAVEAVPLDGPVEDLNLMLADPALSGEMLYRPLLGSMVLLREPGTVSALHLLDGSAHVQGNDAPQLAAADTLLVDGNRPGPTVRLVGSGAALFVRITGN